MATQVSYQRLNSELLQLKKSESATAADFINLFNRWVANIENSTTFDEFESWTSTVFTITDYAKGHEVELKKRALEVIDKKSDFISADLEDFLQRFRYTETT